MIGLGVVVIGIMFLFFLPWIGIPIGILGLVLLIFWIVGLVRGRGAS
jgi:hypothetical protein